MTLSRPTARLLPFTIAMLAVLLAVKAVDLVRDVASARYGTTAMVTEARAATDPPAASAAGSSAPPSAAAPGASPAKPQPGAASASAAATHPSPGAAPSRAEGAGPPPVSDNERAILLELRQRRAQLDAREAALATRESILAAAEQKLEAQTQALTALQKKLQDLQDQQAARDKGSEANWQGLVKLYEDMKPRDAATIFNDLDMPVLLPLVDRMKELKAASILAAMNPDKARQVTTGLAKLRTHHEAAGATSPPGG